MRITPYIHFQGDCGAAFDFYAQVLGGKITMRMTFGESPMAAQMDAASHALLMHVRLEAGDTVLLGSDAPPSMPVPAKGGFSVMILSKDPAEARRVFAALAEGGRQDMPIAETFWSPAFGMLVDRFGTPWMVNCEPAGAAG